MEETSNVLFSIGPLEVTRTVVTMWVIIAVLGLVSWLATRRLKTVPGPIQSAAEMAVAKLQDYFTGTMGRHNARRYLMATFFIFIVICNYSGLLPGAGHGFAVPTASLSTTAGLAVIAAFTTHVVGVKRRGLLGYLKTFITPFALMLPLNLIEQVVRPFSLALRLYGEEMVTEQLAGIFPLILPIIMQVMSLLFCLIQAVVFTMLLSIYIEEAVGEEE